MKHLKKFNESKSDIEERVDNMLNIVKTHDFYKQFSDVNDIINELERSEYFSEGKNGREEKRMFKEKWRPTPRVSKTIPRPTESDTEEHTRKMNKFRQEIPKHVHNVDYKIPREFINEIMDRLNHKTMGSEYMEEIKKLNKIFPSTSSKLGHDIWKNNESAYVNISKSIGWDKKEVAIPSMDEIEDLYDRAKNFDENAFTELFKINRFGDPKGDDEIERSNKAVEYFRKTEKIFRELE